MDRVGVGLRAVATLIDLVLLAVVGYVLAALTGQTTDDGFMLRGPPAFAFFLIAIAYYTVMERQFGATVGKVLTGLRVVQSDGTRLDWKASIIRNVSRVIDGLFFYLVAAIAVWTSDGKQRIGDRLADTAVVRRTA